MGNTVEMKKPYAVWAIGEEEYKLKLTTAAIIDLESKYKTNLMELININTEMGLPPLSVMIDITHAALQKYHHGIKKEDVYDMFDRYEEGGGSQLSFFTGVFIEIYTVSGFFSQKMADEIRVGMQKAQEAL